MDDTHDTVSRFSDRAADYVKYRPSYPADAIDCLLGGLGPPDVLVVADVGAGTGISSRLMADRGARVVAVEPSEGMRAAAAPHPRVSWLAARAERLALQAETADLVVCAQSFHWFDPVAVLPEFARVLRPHGRLAIIWNRRSKIDPYTQEYRQAIVDVGGETGAERMPFDPAVVPAGGAFAEAERRAFANAQRLDLEGLIGRARSASYVPKTGAEGTRLIKLLEALHARHADANGIATLVYETEIYLARKPPPASISAASSSCTR
jgi:SAM-dependent methyltransferase